MRLIFQKKENEAQVVCHNTTGIREIRKENRMKAYQLKITIKNSHPPIWRRVIVPGGLSFSQLTLVINTAIGWCGYHCSSYTFGKLGIRLDDDYDEDDALDFAEYNVLDASKYIIDEFLDSVSSFSYEYDFGDDWEHLILIEKTIDDYDQKYPQVLKYRENTPYEDCGGIWGYYDLLRTLEDPNAPNHAAMKAWVDDQEGNEYDLDSVNEELRHMKLTKRKSKPMSRTELYEEYYAGKSFKTIVPPENRDADPFDQDDDLFQEGASAFDTLYYALFAECVERLLRNTKMSEKEIMSALELTEAERSKVSGMMKIRYLKP